MFRSAAKRARLSAGRSGFRFAANETRTPRSSRESLPRGQGRARTRRTFRGSPRQTPDSKIATPSPISLSWRLRKRRAHRRQLGSGDGLPASKSPPTISISKGSSGWECRSAYAHSPGVGRQPLTRYFLENVAKRMVELTGTMNDDRGYLRRVEGNTANSSKQGKITFPAQQTLSTPSKIVVTTSSKWAAPAGPTLAQKSKARIDKAMN